MLKKQETGIVIKLDILEKQAKPVYLGIGSNLGNKLNNIQETKKLLLLNNIYMVNWLPIFMPYKHQQ